MKRWLLLLVAGIVIGGVPPPADLNAVRAEHDPEKRYWLALEFGNEQITQARHAYSEGKPELVQAALQKVEESVQICDEALRGTGKDPSKKSKHFKKAELKIREILRRLKGLEEEVDVEQRDVVTATKQKVQALHDELLLDIVGRRK